MFHKALLAVAFAAVALPAAARTEVNVSVAGLDAKAAHAAILQAAQAACRVELREETDSVRFYLQSTCIESAVAAAETKYASLRGMASR